MVGCYALARLPRRPLIPRLAVLAVMGVVSTLGILLFEAYLWNRYGGIGAFVDAQATWVQPHSAPAIPTEPIGAPSPPQPVTGKFLAKLWSPGAWNNLIPFGILALGCLGLVRPGRLPRQTFLIPVGIFLLGYVPFSGALLNSIGRFLTPSVPAFALVAVLLRRLPWLFWLAAAAQLALQCRYAWAFTRGQWAG
jgi:hypothetical protein